MADRKKQIFQNTNLLLEHYLDLRAYCCNAIYKGHIESEDHIANTVNFEITVQSIRKSQLVTLIIMSHVDTALSLLKEKCIANGTEEKYKVLESLYFDLSMHSLPWADRLLRIAEDLHCDKTMILKWRSEMVNTLSIFIFGAEGLKKMFTSNFYDRE
jgi:hypothetical protein